MKVQAAGSDSLVQIVTEYHVAGRVAQFGRGVMEDVSKRIIKDMASCIQSNLEGSNEPAGDVSAGVERPTPRPEPQAAAPVNALGMFWHLMVLRMRRLFGSKSA
jgi:hypothetical protein